MLENINDFISTNDSALKLIPKIGYLDLKRTRVKENDAENVDLSLKDSAVDKEILNLIDARMTKVIDEGMNQKGHADKDIFRKILKLSKIKKILKKY